MTRWTLLAVTAIVLAGCSTVAGTPTWPGAKLEKVVLTAADFPPGARYDRIVEQPGEPDGAGAPPTMLSDPPGCSDGLTKVIAATAERGPGSAVKYTVLYDGARILMTVLSWNLDLTQLEATATRCAEFQAFFDARSPGIPMATTALPSGPDELIYQQTMTLGATKSSMYMVFANIGTMGLFGMGTPVQIPEIDAKAQLPQTFLDVFGKQSDRMRTL